MKYSTYIFATLGMAFASNAAFAQYQEQLVQFSQTQNGASARISGLGNAQTALGGDFSSISANPAGLGAFTKSEISLSPTLNTNNTNSTYLNNKNNVGNRTAFGLNQVGAVFYSAVKKPKGQDLNKGWLSVNFGIGYNKTQNFNQAFNYGGINNTSTISDFFTDLAQPYASQGYPGDDGNAIGNGTGRLGFRRYLTDYNQDFNAYTPVGSAGTLANGEQAFNNQLQNYTKFGSQSEFGLGLGANYENKLYLGASLNFTSINYNTVSNYQESGSYEGLETKFSGGTYDAFYDQTERVRGSGINLKFGAIYRANDDLRLGLSIATPTWYRMSETYFQSVGSNLNATNGNVDSKTIDADPNQFDYNIRTPYKVSAGASYVIAKKALITADVDYVDYKSAKLTSDDFTLNKAMSLFTQGDLKAAVNYRVGAEVKLSKEFMIRGGYNYQASPYVQQNITTNIISGGLGYMYKNVAVNLTYMNSKYTYTDKPYVAFDNGTEISPMSTVKSNVSNVVMSVGFSF